MRRPFGFFVCAAAALWLTRMPGTAAQYLREEAPQEEDHRELQNSNARVVAEAYECDQYLNELPLAVRNAYKPLGYEIHVCMQPQTPTLNRGVWMRSIDDFTWYKAQGSVTQTAVVNGMDQNRSLQVCIPGRPICSLKTKLLDYFFYNQENATVVGIGTVSMQTNPSPTSRRQLGADENGIFQATVEWTIGAGRDLQSAVGLGGFAGSSGVELQFNVDKLLPPPDFVPYKPDQATSWWHDSPTWLKVLVILGAILIVVMGCSLCMMCFWALRENSKDEVEDKHAKEMEEEDAHQEQAPHAVPVFAANPTWSNYDPESERFDPVPEGTQPTDKDICFDADEHPGTKAMHAAVQKTLKKYPNTEYSPEQYRHIKKQLAGRRFFVCDDEDYPDVWREVPKAELVELLRKEFEDTTTETA